MPDLRPIQRSLASDPGTRTAPNVARFIPSGHRLRTLTTAIVAALAILVLLVEFGAITSSRVVSGPFLPGDDPPTQLLVIPFTPKLGPLMARYDDIGTMNPERLRLWVNGHEYSLQHAPHDDIRNGRPQAFSYWNGTVFFSLPPGIDNDDSVEVRLKAPLQFKSAWISVALLGALYGFWHLTARRLYSPAELGRLFSLPAVAIGYALCVGGALAIAYFAVSLWAWATGWALPTTAPIRLFHIGRYLAGQSSLFAPLVLALGSVGFLAHAAAVYYNAQMEEILRAESRLTRAAFWWGLPIVSAVAVLSVSSVWAGLPQSNEYSVFSLIGLVPFSDTSDYFGEAMGLGRDGVLGLAGARRTLAEIVRASLFAATDFNYARCLLVQALLFSGAAFAAAVAVARWRGVWAAFVFYAIVYSATVKFLPSFATESLGIFWALLAIPFFIAALRWRSLADAIVGILLMSVALVVRLGCMLTLPALILWTMLGFGKGYTRKIAIGAAGSAIVVAVFLLNSGLAKVYTNDAGLAGSNFAYTFCGLTLGSDWSECPRRYTGTLPPEQRYDEKRVVALMYAKSIENFKADPTVFFKSLVDGTKLFVETLPETLVESVFAGDAISPFVAVFFVLAGFGLIVLCARTDRDEVVFWALFGAGTLASAAIIFYGDGRRIMIANYPLAALLLASGLAVTWRRQWAPVAKSVSATVLGTGLSVALLMLAVLAPILIVRFKPEYYNVAIDPTKQNDVFGGDRMSGVLVLDDGIGLPKGVPAVHLSDFRNAIIESNVEEYQGLVTPEPPPRPFAFLISPSRLYGQSNKTIFIAPPDVLSRRDVPTWHFDLTEFGVRPNDGSYWYQVTRAQPFDPSGGVQPVARAAAPDVPNAR